MSVASASGRLAASTTTLISTATVDRTLNITLFNTDTVGETADLTVLTNGATARTVFHAVLATKETAIIKGLFLGAADVLKGFADIADKVDYTISPSNSSDYGAQTLTADGELKVSQ